MCCPWLCGCGPGHGAWISGPHVEAAWGEHAVASPLPQAPTEASDQRPRVAPARCGCPWCAGAASWPAASRLGGPQARLKWLLQPVCSNLGRPLPCPWALPGTEGQHRGDLSARSCPSKGPQFIFGEEALDGRFGPHGQPSQEIGVQTCLGGLGPHWASPDILTGCGPAQGGPGPTGLLLVVVAPSLGPWLAPPGGPGLGMARAGGAWGLPSR